MHSSKYPNLTPENHAKTSDATRKYNCLAWAVSETNRWWDPTDPQYFWPSSVPQSLTLDNVIKALDTRGFHPCKDDSLQTGTEKVAVYGIAQANGRVRPTHVARQLANGRWTSKLGDDVDIEHKTPEDLSGPFYGEVVRYLSRT